jgi:hypothetical protein
MKKITILITVLIFPILSKGQVTTTILYESPDSQINVYIVSQGFTNASMATFNTFTDNFLTYLWSVPPYQQTQTRFRIIRVNIPAAVENQPGAFFQFENAHSNPPHDDDLSSYISEPYSFPHSAAYDQYLSFECYADFRTRMNNLKPQLPGFNSKSYIIGIFNNNYYTGGGGEYAFATTYGTTYNFTHLMHKVLVHEFSHTFGLLADEYVRAPSTPYQKNPSDCSVLLDGSGNPLVIDPQTFPLFNDRNVTDKTSLETIPWNYLIQGQSVPMCDYNLSCPTNGVGLYNGAAYSVNTGTQWYRSEDFCFMRTLGYPFCQTCVDLINERIQEHLCYPINNVTEDFISKHQYITHWRKASNLITSTSTIGNAISVNYVSGNSIVLNTGFTARTGSDFRAYIGDCSIIPLVNTYKVTSATGPTSAPNQKTNTIVRINEEDVKIAPVPSTNRVDITADNQLITNLAVYSLDGKLIITHKLASVQTFSLDVTNYANGTYIVSIQTDKGETISKKLIKE